MEGCHPMPIEDAALDKWVKIARDFAMCNGVVYRTVEAPERADRVIHAPFQLLPSPVPRHCYVKACDVMADFNLLIHRVAHDHEFLTNCLRSTIKADDFTKNYWKVYEKVRDEGAGQPLSLAMNRSDYMFHRAAEKEGEQLKQIEFNTMASSFGGLSQGITNIHRSMLATTGNADKIENCPDNPCVEVLAEGMHTAWKAYGNPNAVVVTLVLPDERNVYDQRLLEAELLRREPRVRHERRSLRDFEERGSLGPDRELMIDGLEVCIVYFRMCYVPDHFPTEKSWPARLMMERSKALKTPSAAYFLAGTKKVQQELARPGVLERFLRDPESVKAIRDTFAGQYSLEMGEEGDKTLAMALADPENFVLKPQREGGGNNHFGLEMVPLLERLGRSEERSAYVLMERLRPAEVRNYAVRAGDARPALAAMVSELGVFGALVGTSDDILCNAHGGHLLRTKTQGTDEGGVAAGYSALDSPYLVS